MTRTVVLSGVAGSGKSAVAAEVVRRTGWAFLEGDDLHPAANRDRMAAGVPLTDADREPWLHEIAARIGGFEAAGRDAVLTCSALRRTYRDLLAAGHPSVWFVLLAVPPEVLAERLAHRMGHFLPAGMLPSQLAALEPLEPGEPGTAVDGTGTVGEVAGRVLAALP